ncbi:MAG: hypothetical protein H6563_13900 [Lewinellaceae bacterium]|nr:hypothetical protein [Lewinellaceae bacterium]
MKTIYLFFFLALGAGVAAQSPCDLVTVQDIRYDAFSNAELVVEVTNDSPSIFDYPGFILYDTNGDTVAKEVVNFFGIGTFHIAVLGVYPDAQITSDTFQGTLELWTGFYTDLACTFDIFEPLCPGTDCDTLIFDFSNLGGALTNGFFTYSVKDQAGAVQVAKDFSLEDTVQQFQDTLCLPPGDYTLSISTDDNPVAGQPYFMLFEPRSQYWASSLTGPFDQGAPVMSIPFTLYGACVPPISGAEEAVPAAPVTLTWTSEGVWARAAKGEIEELILYDLAGRRIASRTGPAQELFLPGENWRGLYVVTCRLDTGGRFSEKVHF